LEFDKKAVDQSHQGAIAFDEATQFTELHPEWRGARTTELIE
jgi:hypothetical protein